MSASQAILSGSKPIADDRVCIVGASWAHLGRIANDHEQIVGAS